MTEELHQYRHIHVELAPDGTLVYTDENDQPGHHKRSHQDHLDYFQWTSNSGALKISFPGKHPFDDHPTTSEAGKPTPPVRVSKMANGGIYKYDVTLTDLSGIAHHEDPTIEIGQDSLFVVEPGRKEPLR